MNRILVENRIGNQPKGRKHIRLAVGITSMLMVFWLFAGSSVKCLAYTQTEGTVSADSAKVRSEADTGSGVLASVTKGNKVTIADEVKDSSGAVWYKVFVDANTFGYIRSDLVEKGAAQEGSAAETDETAADTTKQEETKPAPEPTVATPLDSQPATITAANCRVRQGASTDHDTVASLPQGTEVTVTGQADGRDGKTWYQISCTYNGKSVIGYVRSDLMKMGAAEPPAGGGDASESAEPADGAEGEPVEGAEGTAENPEGEGTDPAPDDNADAAEPAPENGDGRYEAVYTQDDAGENVWYLYDNQAGTRQKIDGLLAAAEAGSQNSDAEAGQVSKQKIVIIVLAVVIVILAVAITLLLFKIKDLNEELEYADDDEDDEDDEGEEPEPRRPVRQAPRSSGRAPAAGGGRPSPARQGAAPARSIPAGAGSGGARPAPAKRPVSGGRPADTGRDPDGREYPRERRSVPPTGARPVRPEDSRPQVRDGERAQPRPRTPQGQPRNTEPQSRPEPQRKAKNFLVDDDDFEFEFLNMDDKE